MRAGFVLFAALLGAECQRSPAEDFPSRSYVPALPPSAASPQEAPEANGAGDAPARPPINRCVAPTPLKPPASAPPLSASACPPDPEPAIAARPIVSLVSVTFPDAAPTATSVRAELVRSPHDTAR